MRMMQEPQQRQSLGHILSYRMADILWHRHYEAGMLFLGLIWLAWGLALANPYASVFASTPAYCYLAVVMTEAHWAVLVIALALNVLAAMISWNRYWRIGATCLIAALGLWIGVSIGLANPSGTGVAVYLGLGAMGLWTFARSWRGVA